MSLGAQFRRFGEKAADFRQDVFGTAEDGSPCQIDYDRGQFTFDGYYTPIRSKAQTDEAGFVDDHDSMVRFRKSGSFVPEFKKQVKIMEGEREILLVINEILGSHPASVEWRLGCEALNG